MEIELKSGRKIGDGHAPFIIAEVGSNWETLDHCLHSITMAKACGADAVKFQAFNHEALYGQPLDRDSYLLQHGILFDKNDPGKQDMRGALPLDWLPHLKAKADSCGIEFMCTAFSPELVDAVDPFVNAHKIASAELTHVRILERIRAKGKPVLLSTGASGTADIAKALECLTGFSDEVPPVPVVLLYCVAAYPTREVNLERIKGLREQFKVLSGFSDHTTNVHPVPRCAVVGGACVLEKHVNFEGVTGPDSPHSLGTDEFKRMVRYANGESDLGSGSDEERGMVLRGNRRLIATRSIAAGDVLEEERNFGCYRSLKDDTHAYSPWMIAKVHGRTALKAIQAGDGIGPGDV